MQSLSDEEWERIKERARTKLEQSGWVDDVRQQCRGERDTHRRVLVHRKFEERVNVWHLWIRCVAEFVKTNVEEIRHEVMVAHVEQEAKRAVPDQVKAELLSQIKSILQKKG